MRGIDWLFLALATAAAAAAIACAYYARNCQDNTDLVIRELLFRLRLERTDDIITDLRKEK